MLGNTTSSVCWSPVQFECVVALWIWRLVSPVLLTLGTCGNILSIMVLTRRRLRVKATSIYLIFLALSDLTMLWSSLTRGVLLRFGTDMKTWSGFNCVLHSWVVHTSGGFSGWLLVLLTIDRLLFTMFPIFAREKITKQRTLIITVIVFCFAGLFSGHLLFLFEFKNQTPAKDGAENNTDFVICTKKSGNLGTFVARQWRFLVMVCLTLIPGIFIIGGNTAIAIKLLVDRKRKMRSVHPEFRRMTPLDEKRKATAKMLFFLCSFFLLTTVPYSSFRVIISTYFSSVDDGKMYARLQLIQVVVLMLFYCNNTFNVLLYYMTGSLFKEELRIMATSFHKKCTAAFSWATCESNDEEINRS